LPFILVRYTKALKEFQPALIECSQQEMAGCFYVGCVNPKTTSQDQLLLLLYNKNKCNCQYLFQYFQLHFYCTKTSISLL